MISSPLMSSDYERLVPNYAGYLARPVADATVAEAEAAEPPKDDSAPA
jgi:hypothetical protein